MLILMKWLYIQMIVYRNVIWISFGVVKIIWGKVGGFFFVYLSAKNIHSSFREKYSYVILAISSFMFWRQIRKIKTYFLPKSFTPLELLYMNTVKVKKNWNTKNFHLNCPNNRTVMVLQCINAVFQVRKSKSDNLGIIFYILKKHMLWPLIRTVSLRRF